MPRANNRGPRDFNEPRELREPREPRAAGPDYREMSWERKGPLSPAVPPPMERGGSRAGSQAGHRMGERTNSFANRGASPAAWGPGEGRQDSRPPPAREPRERAPTAAEQESSWRSKMRPDPALSKSPVPSRSGSEAPPSPALAPAAPAGPAGRPKLNLQKRTVSEAPGIMSPSLTSDSKASPFGAARPIDTAAREREIEEKKQKELQEKKEADEKAKEEKRLAKEAAAKEAAEKAAAEPAESNEEAEKPAAPADVPADVETADTAAAAEGAPKDTENSAEAVQNGAEGSEDKIPIRSRGEPREPRDQPKSRANESGNWRSASTRGAPSGSRRGGAAPRGGRDFSERQNSRRGSDQRRASEQRRGSDQQQPSTPTTPAVDADGWTTVSTTAKGRRGRPVVS